MYNNRGSTKPEILHVNGFSYDLVHMHNIIIFPLTVENADHIPTYITMQGLVKEVTPQQQ